MKNKITLSILIILTFGGYRILNAQNIVVADKPSENTNQKEDKTEAELALKSKRSHFELTVLLTNENETYQSDWSDNSENTTTLTIGGLALFPINSNFLLGASTQITRMNYDNSDYDETLTATYISIMPYVRLVKPLKENAELYFDFGIGKQFDMSEDANDDIKNFQLSGSINAAFKVTDRFFIKTTLLNMSYIKVYYDVESVNYSNSILNLGTIFDGPSIGMVFKL